MSLSSNSVTITDPRFALLADRYFARTRRSRELAAESLKHLADVRGTLRLHPGWEGLVYPIISNRADGARLWDLDGNEYVDMTMGFGVHLFGHRAPFIEEAVRGRLACGWPLAVENELSGIVAKQLCAITGMDRALLTNTGSEAVMSAVRLARMSTGRELIVMFRNSYHGWYDGTFAVPGENGRARPGSPGIPASSTERIRVLDYCEPETLERIDALGEEVAAVIVEPVQARQPELEPGSFLLELRRICDAHGATLIFDEMLTGFRLAPGGAQEFFGVRADLASYGKIMGGGLPIGAVAGSERLLASADGGRSAFREIELAAPRTVITGTYSRHSLSMAAAQAALSKITAEPQRLYPQLETVSGQLQQGLVEVFHRHGAPFRVGRRASMVRVHGEDPVLRELLSFHLVTRGVYVCETRTWFVSAVHDTADIDLVVAAVDDSLTEMAAFW